MRASYGYETRGLTIKSAAGSRLSRSKYRPMRASDSGLPPNIRPSRVVTRQRSYELPGHKLLERFAQLRAQPPEVHDELLLIIHRKIIEHSSHSTDHSR